MAYSYSLYAGNGSNTTFAFSFPYIDKAHVFAEVNGNPTAFAWLNTNTVSITPAPAAGTVVRVKRVTPKEQAPVDFSDGSVLKAVDLDALARFNLFCAQEAQDSADSAVVLNHSGMLDGRGRRTINFADPTESSGLVTRNYFENIYRPELDGKVTTAQGYATGAANSAASANTSRIDAENAKVAAQDALADLRARYQGAYATAPYTRPDGSPLQDGDSYFRSVNPRGIYVYTAGVWAKAGSAVEGYVNTPSVPVVAQAGQTTVTVPGGYDPGFITVFVNGAKWDAPDIDVTSGTQIVFASPLAGEEEVSWVAYATFVASNFARPDGATQIGYQATGSSAPFRMVADKLGEDVSVKDFGAKGDGVTDDTAAIQAALTAAIQRSEQTGTTAVLHFPNGAYRMRGRATGKFLSTTSQQRGLHLRGDGLYATTIIADPTNTDGLFKLGSVTTNEVFEMSALSLLSDLPEDAPTNNGIAVEIYTDAAFGGAGWGDRPLHTVFVHEVYLSGLHSTSQGFARRGNFSVGFKVTNKYNPKFSHVRILGRYGKSDLTPRTGCEAGIQLQGCYSPWFNYVYVHGNWNYSVVCDGEPNASQDIEGFSINMCVFVNSNYGFVYRHSYDPINSLKLYEPGGTVQGSHFDCKKRGVWIRSHQQIQITNCSIYTPRSRTEAADETIPCGLFLENVSFTHIRAQVSGGWYTNASDFAAGIVIQGYSDVLNIECDFSMSGVGVYNNAITAEKTISMVNSKWERRVSELSPHLLTFVPFVDKTDSMLVQHISQVSEGGKWKNKFNLTAQNTGASPNLALALRTHNQDYASRSNPTLGAVESYGLNSSGTEVRTGTISFGMRTNAAGAEYGDTYFYGLRNGSLAEALKLTYVDGELNTTMRFQVYVGGAWLTKAITLGPPDSGGTGYRTLRVLN